MFIVLQGLDGAGKSTLMTLLVAALLPTTGSILVDGQPLTRVERQLKARLGYLPRTSDCSTNSLWNSFWTTWQPSRDCGAPEPSYGR